MGNTINCISIYQCILCYATMGVRRSWINLQSLSIQHLTGISEVSVSMAAVQTQWAAQHPHRVDALQCHAGGVSRARDGNL